jgi:hypothetical protein
MAKWKNFLIAASVALTPLLATCYSNTSSSNVNAEKQEKQEKYRYELDGRVVTINVCQTTLTASMYERIKTLSIENLETGTTIQEAEAITGCDFQKVKTVEKDQHIYQAINTNQKGKVTRQIILGGVYYEEDRRTYTVRKTQRGLY